MPDSTASNNTAAANEREEVPAGEHKEAWTGKTQGGDSSKTVALAPEPPQEARLAKVVAAKVPLLEAAQPLLRALTEIPRELSLEGIEVYHRLLKREVKTFHSLCGNARIRPEYVVAASYALCTAIDEAANSTSWGGAKDGEAGQVGVWAGRQLAHEFHGDGKGGEKVFLLIGRLAAAPQEHIDLLDLMFFILSLGFEGRYRTAANGRRELETIRHRLHAMVMAARGDVPRELSPNWRGVGAGKFRLLRSVPVWVTASLLALALFGLFAWYKYQLGQADAEVQARIRAIGAMQPPPAPPAPPRKSLRLKELLSAEIARGSVSVEEDDAHSAVSFKGDDMFVPGQARLSARTVPIIAKVAREINEVAGSVRVTGHSDNQPIKTREFPDNQALSARRATVVAEMLEGSGVAANRVQVEGKGDTQPVADNATPAGRARNRRVDIVVMQR